MGISLAPVFGIRGSRPGFGISLAPVLRKPGVQIRLWNDLGSGFWKPGVQIRCSKKLWSGSIKISINHVFLNSDVWAVLGPEHWAAPKINDFLKSRVAHICIEILCKTTLIYGEKPHFEIKRVKHIFIDMYFLAKIIVYVKKFLTRITNTNRSNTVPQRVKHSSFVGLRIRSRWKL